MSVAVNQAVLRVQIVRRGRDALLAFPSASY